MFKKIWLIWCRTVDHRIGKTNDDEPNIPILSLKEAQVSLFLRTFIIFVNLVTCFFIVANIIHKWWKFSRQKVKFWYNNNLIIDMILLANTYEAGGFSDVDWFYFVGPIVVYIFLEMMSGGGDGFDGFG